MKTRIAPTPSGFLHIGNAVSFLITFCLSKMKNGKILLRIDDLDRERYRKEYVDDIFKSLDWLEIQIDEGPQTVTDFEKNWTQHVRRELYEKALYDAKNSNHLFACDCSRKKIVNENGINTYSGKCLNAHKPFLENYAWRWKVESNTQIHWIDLFLHFTKLNLHEKMGDFIVRQKNGFPSYQLSSYMDDIYFNITHIIRGEDLITSTAAQLYLSHCFESHSFRNIIFGHHPLILDDHGIKLSKSAGARSIKSMRESGFSPKLLIEVARKLLGLPAQKIETTAELLQLCKENNPFKDE